MFAVRDMDDRELLAAAEFARRAGVYDRAIDTAGRTEQLHDYRMRYLAPFREVFTRLRRRLRPGGSLGARPGAPGEPLHRATRARARAPPGLMQLMPHTARWVAQKIGYRGYSAKRVTDVDTNITLGTRYLKFVLDGTGHPVLASAAYNAGPNRARRWVGAGRWKARSSSRPFRTARRAST